MNDPSKTGNMTEHGLSFYSEMLGGRLHFLHFETRNIGSAIDMLSSTSVTENIRTIGCTGGGAHKFAQEFEDNLDIKFQVMIYYPPYNVSDQNLPPHCQMLYNAIVL